MQSFHDSDCDGDPVEFTTTIGPPKVVALQLQADDGNCFITVETPGTYRLKVSYRYSTVDTKGQVINELAPVYVTERVVAYNSGSGLSISNAWMIRDIDGCEEGDAFPMKIDIVELEEV